MRNLSYWVPVATVALNASKNAGILAASILSAHDKKLATRLDRYKQDMGAEVRAKASRLKAEGWPNPFDQSI